MSDNLVTENTAPITEFQYELQTPYSYAYKGDMVNALSITLTAPSVKTPHRADLKQCFFRAIPKNTGQEDPASAGGSDDLKASDILFTISMSNGVSLSAFIEYGKGLLSSGVALIDDQVKLTKPLIDAMDPEEFENLLGEYMVNFILASALKKLREA